MSSSTAEQCRALTGSGTRCSLSATDGEFCHQHDESDPTIDEQSENPSNDEQSENQPNDDESENQSNDDQSENQSDEDDGQPSDDQTEPATGTDDAVSESASNGIMAAHQAVLDVGGELLNNEIHNIISVSRAGDGWKAKVEVIDRKAVPDTQDILAQYEIDLDPDDTVSGYRRTGRYRRGDTERDEYLE